MSEFLAMESRTAPARRRRLTSGDGEVRTPEQLEKPLVELGEAMVGAAEARRF